MLKIVPLVENTTASPEYRCKHGLCLYIQTEKHKILFDLGQDDLFIENARKLDVNLSDIDTVVISHGHKDHGGGLKTFLSVNTKAKVYVRRGAFEPHYIKVLGVPLFVGLDRELLANPQLVFTDEKTVIDGELMLFSGVVPGAYPMKSNQVLFSKRQGKLLPDDFCHEQNLVITAGEKKLLVSGCSHAGIVSIQSKAEELTSQQMETVVGGFHLYNPPTKRYESTELIDAVASALRKKGSVYYTCHCTGRQAYERMKETLGEKLQYLSVGRSIELQGEMTVETKVVTRKGQK